MLPSLSAPAPQRGGGGVEEEGGDSSAPFPSANASSQPPAGCAGAESRTHCAQDKTLQSIFPTYDPAVPLERQEYAPAVPLGPTLLPRAVISRQSVYYDEAGSPAR
ncbi:hypothetical protein E4U41_003105, partial [Claviceps citrina]